MLKKINCFLVIYRLHLHWEINQGQYVTVYIYGKTWERGKRERVEKKEKVPQKLYSHCSVQNVNNYFYICLSHCFSLFYFPILDNQIECRKISAQLLTQRGWIMQLWKHKNRFKSLLTHWIWLLLLFTWFTCFIFLLSSLNEGEAVISRE